VLAVTVRDLWEACLRLLFPVPCLLCAGPLTSGAAGQVCGPCWAALPRLPAHGCAACGRPFAPVRAAPDEPGHPGHSHVRCGACQRQRPPYELARAALPYGDTGPVKPLVLALKYGHRQALAAPLARVMHTAAAGRVDLTAFDALVPVPLHRQRRRERGFNQAAALADGLGRAVGRPVLRRVLVRVRPTPPQTGDKTARRRNVRGAFAVPAPGAVREKRLLLIDDVFTTGATAEECARVLRRAGAAAVGVYTLARVT